MKVFGGALTGFVSSLLAIELGYDIATWEYWSIFGVCMGIYICAALDW